MKVENHCLSPSVTHFLLLLHFGISRTCHMFITPPEAEPPAHAALLHSYTLGLASLQSILHAGAIWTVSFGYPKRFCAMLVWSALKTPCCTEDEV